MRQDYLIAEGLLSPYASGSESVSPEARQMALSRIRQLAPHEVGHAIGFGHQYYDSSLGYISVMDYPHPRIEAEGRRNARSVAGLRGGHR